MNQTCRHCNSNFNLNEFHDCEQGRKGHVKPVEKNVKDLRAPLLPKKTQPTHDCCASINDFLCCFLDIFCTGCSRNDICICVVTDIDCD